MISIFGEVWFMNDNGKDAIDGFGYRVAYTLSKRGAFPAFLTGLGQDERGRFVVERLVEDEVMFDPDLALLPFPTAGWGEEVGHTAMANVPGDMLREAASMHSNLNLGYFTTPVFMCSPSREAYMRELDHTPIPVLQLVDGLRLEDDVFHQCESRVKFVMSDHEDERIRKECVIFHDGKAELRKDGKVLATKLYEDKFEFISDLLEALDTENPDADILSMLAGFMDK